MITKDQMIPLLLEVLPGFKSNWDSFLEEWSDPSEWPETGLPIYILFVDLAPFLIRLLESKDFKSLESTFSVIESWQAFGDPYVKEAAIVGILEDLQNKNLHTTTSPKDFEPFLGPLSRTSWENLYSFWQDRSE